MNVDKAKQLHEQAANLFNVGMMRLNDMAATMNQLAQVMNALQEELRKETPAPPAKRHGK